MSFGPESNNPRERRSYAHSVILSLREGRKPFYAARQAVEMASRTTKGGSSGFTHALAHAALSETNVNNFVEEFSDSAIEHRDDPFELRAGGWSNWYVDSRHGLSSGSSLEAASSMMWAAATLRGVEYDIVVGMGVAGTALSSGIGHNGERDKKMAWASDRKGEDYGIWGAKVKGKKVWVVDDIATTGDSLLTLIAMVRADGGEVVAADTLTDRSHGKAEEVVRAVGVILHSVFEFSEQTGQILPFPGLVVSHDVTGVAA